MTNPTEDQVNRVLAKFEGWTLMEWVDFHGYPPSSDSLESFPDYFTSIEDALRVAEKLDCYILSHHKGNKVRAYVSHGTSDNSTMADTPAAALALAAYRVLEEV